MLVTIKGSSKPVELNEKVARHLIKKDLAYETREVKPEPVQEAKVTETEATETDSVEISPRTGLPKRKYRRRDMQAED